MYYLNSPSVFYLLLLTPLIWLYKPRSPDEESKGIPFFLAAGISDLPLNPLLKYRIYIINTLRTCSLILLIMALARPQTGTYATEQLGEGRDLLITVDSSGSMKALDFQFEGKPASRLDVLKGVAENFIKGRVGDRIGLIIFGEEVFTQCPLTSDHSLLLQYLSAVEVGAAGDSTALGDALALSVKRLREIDSNSKAIILVTDGVKNSGQMDPIQAAEIAKRLGIKVYTIGIGQNEPVPFPVEDIYGRSTIVYQHIPIDEETLKKIADITGGTYFNAEKTEDLKTIYAEIDKLELREAPSPQLISQEEHFLPFLLTGLILVMLTEILSRTTLRVIS